MTLAVADQTTGKSQYQNSQYQSSQVLSQAFAAAFGRPPSLMAQAPGRVNLIGEHTDYNQGYVLPCAIDFHTLVAVRPRRDRQVQVLALNYPGEQDSFDLSAPEAAPGPGWGRYVRAVFQVLARSGLEQPGCELMILGDVPQGAGLSSSAALEIALLLALTALIGVQLPPAELARLGQMAENDFVGCACGIMDQLISAAAVAGHASLIDCRDNSLNPVALPKDLSLLIVNSNVRRGLVDSEYNLRRQQCREAANLLGLTSLRDLEESALGEAIGQLPQLPGMRASHVLGENRRTLALARAFARDDRTAIQALMAASHASMRDLFQITCPQIDLLVQLLDSVAGTRGGARMTGGGFGGCVVALLPRELLPEAQSLISREYPAQTGLNADFYTPAVVGGAHLLEHC
ncbi:galactokinase [Shewanella cyperi]|uniref:Galactokinase n=1 Tax=Shewanella cyperi TaxID=2814292 RepID=A0A974XNQ4_9GAMM|nr:galactokinase [Shewanella cyperi]QSX30628.1 galactokinase [Shewanella cyperi]